MKFKNLPHQLIASLFAILMLFSISSFAQSPQANKESKVKVKIKVKEDGETKEVNKEIDLDDLGGWESLFHELDVLKEIDFDKKDGKLSISIKKENGKKEAIKQVYVDIEGRHSCTQKNSNKHNGNIEPRAFLGVYGATVVETVKPGYGSRVTSVVQNSGAAKAGLKQGDIIVGVNGKKVEHHKGLVKLIREQQPEDIIKLDLYRDGTKMSLQAELTEKKPESKTSKHCILKQGNGGFDFQFNINEEEIEELIKECAKNGKTYAKAFHRGHRMDDNQAFLGVTPAWNSGEQKGVKIGNVIDESTAQEMGLESGDRILSINGNNIENFDDLVATLETMKPGDKATIQIERDGQKMTKSGKLKTVKDTHPMHKLKMKLEGMANEMNEYEIDIEAFEEGIESLVDAFDGKNLPVSKVTISPNPTEGIIDLNFEFKKKGEATLSLVDMSGREVYHERINSSATKYERKIDLTKEPEGIYFITITQNGQQFNQKIVRN